MTERVNLVDWSGRKVALVSHPALGDTTLFLRLAWRLQAAGAEVTLYSKSFVAAQCYLDGLHVISSEAPDLPGLSAEHDLVICFLNWLIDAERSGVDVRSLANVACVAGKRLPMDLQQRTVRIAGLELAGASQVICRDTKAGKTMVEWIDLYACEVLGLDTNLVVSGFQALPPVSEDAGRRIAIFPTTPHISKNYWPAGFRSLAIRLQKMGWCVEFVGVPAEHEDLTARYPGFSVHAFQDMKALIDYLRSCSVVISNDSGGGHLASLLGMRTFTITRRKTHFTWRPGFNSMNSVINPVFTFKFLGRIVWRPFIPQRRLLNALAIKPEAHG